jgi:hypothetical protein
MAEYLFNDLAPMSLDEGKDAHRHLSGLRHLDHPGLAEGTAQEVLDEALHPFRIAGLEPHALVDAET